tara:strand:- start:109 stop:564 length:456 start_codon:yes stop_codon:yes gene_type:complete
MENFKMKFSGILAELVFISLLIFIIAYFNIARTQEVDSIPIYKVPGPPMYCGERKDLTKTLNGFKEEELVVLTGTEINSAEPYQIIYRNINTGSWSIIMYNISGAPPNISCLLSGGPKSYILPSIEDIIPMIEKQKKGLDTFKISQKDITS